MRSHYGAGERICSPSQLECVEGVQVDQEDQCLENCQGTIVEVQKVNSFINQDSLTQYLADLEKYKFPEGTNLSFLYDMKSNHLSQSQGFQLIGFDISLELKFQSKLKFVQISFSSSTFDRIHKV